jgi:hypothetical protein
VADVTDRMIESWRLCIEHKHQPQPRLGEFNWPQVLTMALDEIERLRTEVATLAPYRELWLQARDEKRQTYGESWTRVLDELQAQRELVSVPASRWATLVKDVSEIVEHQEARIVKALAWLHDANPDPERNGDLFGELRAILEGTGA